MQVTKKQKIAATVLVACIILYACLGFYLLPYLVVNKLPEILHEKTGQPAKLQAFKFNPFSFEMEMDDFSLAGGADKNLVSFDVFAVNFNAWDSLKHQAVVFDSVVLRKPVVNIKREADGRFNFSSMIPKSDSEKSEPPKKSASPTPLTLHHLEIDNGGVSWLDVSKGEPQIAALQPINLNITELTTAINVKGHFDLGFDLASGGHLQWQGELGLEPVSSSGHISLDQLNLSYIWKEFLQAKLPVAIPEGSLNVHTDYQANMVEGKLALLINKGEADINQLKITEKEKDTPLITIPSIAFHGINLDLDKKTLGVASLESKDVNINASLEADGRVNYQRLFVKDQADATQAAPTPEPAAAPKPEAGAGAEPAWRVNLDELALNNYQLQFTDQTRKKPQLFQLSGINFKLLKFSNQQTEKLPLEFSATLNKDGKLKVTGNIDLNPFNAALGLDVKNVGLIFLQDYLDDYLQLQLVDGAFNASGNLNISTANDFQLLFKGDADIANLLTRDKVYNKDFLKWSDLNLQQIDVDLAKQKYGLAKVVLDHPYLRVTIQKDRTTNFKDIFPTQKPAVKPAAKQSAKAKMADQPASGPIINIGKIELDAGYSDFSDYSLILPFVTEMDELNGEIDGFASNQDNPLKLQLKGKVYHMALVYIKGSYQLKSGDSNVALKFDHMPLPLITPYMADFAGYKIEKGQMALDLQYKINKGQLEAQNKIFIDQLTLGDQVENPHATSLPLKFAIALLKDADGKINLDFPVTGSLNDPQFSVGALIVDVLGNLIKKLVTSPFHALGGLLSDDQDYSTVKFPPGSAELQTSETEKLDQLSKALQSKPELTLDIKGKSNQNLDWPVIRSDALKDILKKMKSGELRDKGQTIRSEYIELTDDEYKRLLEKFFKEVYPQDIDYSLLGKPRIKAQPDADFYETAKKKLEDMLQPEPQRLNDLAVARASAISKYLLEKGHIDLNRQYILSTEIDNGNATDILSILSLNVAH
ncbi:MAG: DUF748 domain-containing protein [Methylomonas sp.]|jgi:uncharacterized protein involved in outer membrane biogenesis